MNPNAHHVVAALLGTVDPKAVHPIGNGMCEILMHRSPRTTYSHCNRTILFCPFRVYPHHTFPVFFTSLGMTTPQNFIHLNQPKPLPPSWPVLPTEHVTEADSGEDSNVETSGYDKRKFRRVRLSQISNVDFNSIGQVTLQIAWIRSKNSPMAFFRDMPKTLQLQIIEQTSSNSLHAEGAEAEKLQELIQEMTKLYRLPAVASSLPKKRRPSPYTKPSRPNSAASLRKSEKSTSGDEKIARPGSSQSVRGSSGLRIEMTEGLEKFDHRQDSGYSYLPEGFHPIQKLDIHEVDSLASDSHDDDHLPSDVIPDGDLQALLIQHTMVYMKHYNNIKKAANQRITNAEAEVEKYKGLFQRLNADNVRLKRDLEAAEARIQEITRERDHYSKQYIEKLEQGEKVAAYQYVAQMQVAKQLQTIEAFSNVFQQEEYLEPLAGSPLPHRPGSSHGMMSETFQRIRRPNSAASGGGEGQTLADLSFGNTPPNVVSGNLDGRRSTPAAQYSYPPFPPQNAFLGQPPN